MDPTDEAYTNSQPSTNFVDYKAVAAKDGISVIRIKSYRMLMAYGFLRNGYLKSLKAYKTPIDMITTSEVSVH